MATTSPWRLLAQGKRAEAFRLLHALYAREGGASEAMELGIAHLWERDYAAAWEHFGSFNQRYPHHVSDTYGMAGVAKWCSGSPEEAIRCWQDGLHCDFSDAAQVDLPLLLYFGSVRVPNIFPRTESMKLLAGRVREERRRTWPLPIAAYLLGEIDEGKLQAEFAHEDESEAVSRRLMGEFCKCVHECSRSRNSKYFRVMNQIGGLTLADYVSSAYTFLAQIWEEEFFLARHEGCARSGNSG
jgi:hypothetical protein